MTVPQVATVSAAASDLSCKLDKGVVGLIGASSIYVA